MYVVVTGPAGSGKSTLSRPLAEQLRLPLLVKDSFKEALLEQGPVATVEDSRVVGRAAVLAMLSAARSLEGGSSTACGSTARSSASDRRAAEAEVVEVFCRCGSRTMRQR